MPIVKVSLLVRELSKGETVTVEATDAAFEADIRAWAEMIGHELVELEVGPVLRAVIRVA